MRYPPEVTISTECSGTERRENITLTNHPIQRITSVPLIPYVVEKSGREERVYDIYSRLLKDRIIFLGQQVDDQISNALVAQMLFFKATTPKRISISTSTALVEVSPRAWRSMTRCNLFLAMWQPTALDKRHPWGLPLLLTAGAKGKRFALPNARIMIHQPLAGMRGTAREVEIHVEELRRIKQRMNELMIEHTGHSLEKIEEDTDRDRFMSADEACEYGLIDKVVSKIDEK